MVQFYIYSYNLLYSFFLFSFFSLAIVYFIGGFLYKRFVLGAKGLEQIPNYKFWEDFGNLQAVSIYFDPFSLEIYK